jgi:hypothetical protein
MRFFSRNKRGTIKPDIWENIPTPKPNELFAAPVSNRLWHPKLAVRASRTKTPDWFKDIPQGADTLKRCYGVADMMRTGYVVPLWATLDVRKPISKLDQRWDARFNIIQSDLFKTESINEKDMEYYFGTKSLMRNQFPVQQTGDKCPVAKRKPRPSSYLKLVTPWVFRTAPGWSCLFLPTIWEPNDKYEVLGAVVHTDYYPNANVVINVLSDESFTIPEGTIMQHVIPFKRDAAILDTEVLRGDQTAHALLRDTGFGAVFTTPEDTHGGYKKEQRRMDAENHDV